MRSTRTTYLVLAAIAMASVVLAACRPLATPGPITPLERAHAHNDYEHDRPLYDALDHGFASVEADVHLVDGQLLVAHDEEDTQEDRTLQSLYLEPLRERVQQNGGRVYAGGPPLTLLIDVKTDAEETYAALRQVLKGYEDILTTFGPGGQKDGAVTVIVSGNRARETMEAEVDRYGVRYAAYDGRLEDLDSGTDTSLIPLISDKWTTYLTWEGRGPMPEEERQKLAAIVEAAHQQGRRVRFWDTPDGRTAAREAVWQTLIEAGVDLINTDDLAGLQRFLLEHDPLLEPVR
jgi:hypothetical protein